MTEFEPRVEVEHEDSLTVARQMFLDQVTQGEINRETIIEAWRLYGDWDAIGNRITGHMQGLPTPEVQCVVHGLSEREHIDVTIASLGHFLFVLDTAGLTEGQTGQLLDGLESGDLEKAMAFCLAMSEVGRRTGDIDERYP